MTPQHLSDILGEIGIYMNNDGLIEQYLYRGFRRYIAER